MRIATVAFIAAALAAPASACDRVEYAEAKTWSTPKLVRSYCESIAENYEGLVNELNHVAPQDRRASRVCTEQAALYKRLLEARGKELDNMDKLCARK